MNARLSWTLSDELIGSKAGPYRITAMLGRGGMGSVFEGKHELIGSRVAIKVMAADSVGCLVSLKRFYREAKVVARIGHHGIVNIFDILSLDDGRPCLVMEMLEGSSLLDVLRRTGPLAPALALKWTEG
ncbi:MAG: protein kinase, partial [Deltaproteobacteria bacterium]|nr:protein kinase [Deltaproteobacteria bacterium]